MTWTLRELTPDRWADFEALRSLGQRGAEVAEAYPVLTRADGRVTASSAYTGVVPMFEKAGFELAEARPQGKQRMRKSLKRADKKKARPADRSPA